MNVKRGDAAPEIIRQWLLAHNWELDNYGGYRKYMTGSWSFIAGHQGPELILRRARLLPMSLSVSGRPAAWRGRFYPHSNAAYYRDIEIEDDVLYQWRKDKRRIYPPTAL